jgi:hypothetical protein
MYITKRSGDTAAGKMHHRRQLTHDDESFTLLWMTKRLQVLFDDDELRQIQRLAKRERLTTAEWVRLRLREAYDQRTKPDTAKKLAAIQRAYRYAGVAPAPDIDQMLAEIERGYSGSADPG